MLPGTTQPSPATDKSATAGSNPSSATVPIPTMSRIAFPQAAINRTPTKAKPATVAPGATPMTPSTPVAKKRKAPATPAKGGTTPGTPSKKTKGDPKPETKAAKVKREKKEREQFLENRKLRYEPKWGMRRDCPLLDKLPGGGPAYHAFSQDITPWRIAHPVKITVPEDPKPTYYVPSGPRSGWAQADYERYKSEKDAFIHGQRSTRNLRASHRLSPLSKRKVRSFPTVKTIMYDGYQATFESMVAAVKIPKTVSPVKVGENGEWLIPDVRTEDELEAEPVKVKYVNAEDSALGESWPSPWRTKAAEDINKEWMKKTDVTGRFQISVDDLKYIRHALVPTHNQYGTKAHAGFQVAAIKALIINIRGSYEGYMDHLAHLEAKAQKAAEAKQAKTDKAIAEGKPTPDQIKWQKQEEKRRKQQQTNPLNIPTRAMATPQGYQQFEQVDHDYCGCCGNYDDY